MKKNKLAVIAAAAAITSSGIVCIADITPTDNIRLALNMYSNQRARQVGDLLTVKVRENTTSKKAETMATKKTANAQAQAPYFGERIGDPGNNPMAVLANAIQRGAGNMPFSQYSIQASSQFDGGGSTNSSETLELDFTVRVVDILENGVLVVRGDRRVTIRNESISMVLTGLVRVRDISDANIVDSSRVADAHIYYETDGEVSRGTRPGLGWRFFQLLNPF